MGGLGFMIRMTPVYGFEAGIRLTQTGGEGELQGQPQKVDIKDGVSSTDFQVVFGAGWCYDFGKLSAWVDGRLCTSIASIDDTPRDRDIQNQSWEVALGVGVPLGRQ